MEQIINLLYQEWVLSLRLARTEGKQIGWECLNREGGKRWRSRAFRDQISWKMRYLSVRSLIFSSQLSWIGNNFWIFGVKKWPKPIYPTLVHFSPFWKAWSHTFDKGKILILISLLKMSYCKITYLFHLGRNLAYIFRHWPQILESSNFQTRRLTRTRLW